MKIISREYGVANNHVKYITLKCAIQKRSYSLNECISWKVKEEWFFELVKYENQDHCMIRFDEMRDSMFIVKCLDYSKHSICDYLYKNVSDKYLKWIILLHLTKLFEKSAEIPNFQKYSKVFNRHIDVCW